MIFIEISENVFAQTLADTERVEDGKDCGGAFITQVFCNETGREIFLIETAEGRYFKIG